MLGDALKIGLKPDEFWNMTPKEFYLALEADVYKQDRLGVMWSTFTAASINVHIGKKSKMLKPTDLYRPIQSRKDAPSKEEWAERKKSFEEAAARMGPQAIPVLPKAQRDALRRQREQEQQNSE